MDLTLLEAAADLGCRPWQAFMKVTLPLSLPGIIAGCLLVFIPAVGEFVIPSLLGDPGMLMIGKVGWGPRLRDSRLTPNEQYVHITLWTLLASPLLLGNDMTQMDDLELNLVTNDEVLGVHQDALGKAADRVSRNGELEVWARPLADGSLAVGLFNRDEMDMKVTATWSDLGIKGRQHVRDLWRQQDLGVFEKRFEAQVPRRGVVMVRIRPSKP